MPIWFKELLEQSKQKGSGRPSDFIFQKMVEEMGEISEARILPNKAMESDAQEAADLVIAALDYIFIRESERLNPLNLKPLGEKVSVSMEELLLRSIRKWKGCPLDSDNFGSYENLITHVQQPTFNSCAAACLSMLTAIPIDCLMVDFHPSYSSGMLKTKDFLRDVGIPFKYGLPEQGFSDDKVFMVSVPSLNLVATEHYIIALCIGDDLQIFDPNFGREGRKYYTFDPEDKNENAVMLSQGYNISFSIELYDLAIWRRKYERLI